MNPTPNAKFRVNPASPSLADANSAQAEALIAALTPVLHTMSVAWIEERRREFMQHFSACGGSFAVCERVAAFLDAHLAARRACTADGAARHQDPVTPLPAPPLPTQGQE